MKKIIFVIIFTLLFVNGCNNSKNKELMNHPKFDYSKYPAEFSYPENNITTFCIDHEGYLYTIAKNGSVVKRYNLKGELNKEFRIGKGSYAGLCIYEKNLYCINEDNYEIIQINLKNGSKTTLYQKDEQYNFYSVDRMIVMENGLYILAKGDFDNYQDNVKFEDGDGYIYLSEQLFYFDFESKTLDKLDVYNIKLIEALDNKTLKIYAYDAEGGYYFTTYDIEQDSFGDKDYTREFKWMISCITDQKSNKLIYYTYGNDKIQISELDNYSYKYEVDKEVTIHKGNDLALLDNFIFYLDSEQQADGSLKEGTVRRIKKDELLAQKAPIRILAEDQLIVGTATSIPGFTYEQEIVTMEDMTYRVLSGDTDYDVFIIESVDIIAKAIRDKGAFYALDDNTAVKEYLNSCFDYVKNTATTKDGRTWTIPQFYYTNNSGQNTRSQR